MMNSHALKLAEAPRGWLGEIAPGAWAQWLLSGGNKSGQGGIRRLLRGVDSLPEATRAAIEIRRARPKAAASAASYAAAVKAVNEIETAHCRWCRAAGAVAGRRDHRRDR